MSRRPLHFGTDGLRGVANLGMLAPEKVLALGRALGRYACRSGNDGGPGRRVVLARDPRRSSPLIAAALAAGATSEGADLLDLGVLPTPALAALLPDLDAGVGVMVSASHNPMQDNGIKVLDGDGGKLADADELWLERQLERPPADPPTGPRVGGMVPLGDGLERYLSHLCEQFQGLDLSGLSIVVDGANGASSLAGPRLFERLGARVHAICCDPDGININDGCGAVHPERMAAEVVARGADLGVALDGDGDRAILAGADGSIQDGDSLLYVIGRQLLEQGRLADQVVVGTVMSNFGLELALSELGARLERTPVGDRHVAAALREHGWSLGGEPSGHLIFGSENRFIGDGLFSALKALAAMRSRQLPLHELSRGLKPVPQVLINIQVAEKPAIESLPSIAALIARAESELEGRGRLLVRYSGTEDLLRVMVEGQDDGQVRRVASEIATLVREEIGVKRLAE